MPEEALEFLAKLPVEKFHGVGKATVPKLHALGFFNGGDLQKADPVDLAEDSEFMVGSFIKRPMEYITRKSKITVSESQLEKNELMVNYYIFRMILKQS